MVLRKQTLLALSLAIASLVGGLYAASSAIFLDSLKKAEEQETRQVVKGVQNVLDQTEADFSARFTDWSAWDDTYNFIIDANSRYLQANTVAETLANLKVNLVLYINTSGQIVYGTGFDLTTQQKTAIPSGLLTHLSQHDLLLKHSSSNSSVTGILLLPEGPMMITSQSIVNSRGQGPSRGTIIFGRYLDINNIERLIKVNRVSLVMHSVQAKKMSPEFQMLPASLVAPESTAIRRLSEKTIAGYSAVKDIYGNPALLLQVNVPREIYAQGQTSLRYLGISLLLVGLVFGGVALLLLDRVVLFQQEREELKKLNQLKDDFLSTISHELRTPLTNIKMAIQMLEVAINKQDNAAKSQQVQRYIKILQAECTKEITLVNDLLDLQRLEAGNQATDLETIYLDSWIQRLIEPFQERVSNCKQTLKLEVPAKLPPVVSSPAILERILAELLNNACKYTPPGEQIIVSADIKLGKMQLQVSNSGIEIPLSEQSQIFNKFYRIPGTDPWRQGGTGLGLALVQKLTEHLGGYIWVESISGQTCFTVELPVSCS